MLFLCINSPASAAALSELVDTKPSIALQQINQQLEQTPNDESSLFLRARALNNVGQTTLAIDIYQQLIKRFPDQPEAYTNLSAIYAKQGKLQQSKEILVSGLLAHEGFSNLYKSLQTVNGQLAAQAYQRALNKEADIKPVKLAQASNLTVAQPIVKEVIKEVQVEVIKEVPVEVIKEVEVVKEVIKEVPVEVVKEVIREVPVPAATVAVNSTTPSATDSIKAVDVLKDQVLGWAKAWSDQDVAAYVAYYKSNYSPSESGFSHRQWVADRDKKLTNKKFIAVSVKGFEQKKINNSSTIEVSFDQTYRSNTVSDTIRKQLTFEKEGGQWKIIREQVIGR